MEVLTRDKLNQLLTKSGHNLISLYMPTHRVGRKIQQDPIRFKNLLSVAEGRLEGRGLRKPQVDSVLERARSLQLDTIFWQHQSDGLALFTYKNFMKYFRLPIQFEELLIVADRFHLKPLLPLLSKNGHFYLLALSQKQVRLLEGSLFNVDELDLEDMPTSLREALGFDDPERQLQFHTGTNAPGNIGRRPAVFHGQGVSEDDTKTDLLRYFQKIDNGLMEVLREEQAPLVLAGVGYLLPIYQEANNYPYLVEQAIEGNPDELDNAHLHQRAWKIVAPIFRADQRQALKRYQELSGLSSEQASKNLETIVPAAFYGRVDTLFVALGTQIWGRFDEGKNILIQHENFHPGDQDLLDLAAVSTLTNGGTVYALDTVDMPEETPIAAIYRYTYEGQH